jgi:hypothetical protein
MTIATTVEPQAALMARAMARLADAKADVAHAEALISALTAQQPNTMTVLQLLTAATLCGLAHDQVNMASTLVQDVRQLQGVTP